MECLRALQNELSKKIKLGLYLDLPDGPHNLLNDLDGFNQNAVKCPSCPFMGKLIVVVEGGIIVSIVNGSSGGCALEN